MGEPNIEAAAGLRQCPTRDDGAVVLIAHTITIPTCQDRQRGHYHKCFTCTHRNERLLSETAFRPRPAGEGTVAPARPPAAGAPGNGVDRGNGVARGNGHVANGSADAKGKPKRR